jgi:ubiquinol-cytochrome c reductase cytochrome b subunit
VRILWKTIADWLESRLGLASTLGPLLRHPVPREVGWAYVFGSATLALFIVQIVTGICLAFVYVPAPDQAYESLLKLNNNDEIFLGWLVRAIHNTSASGMIVMLVVHMTQVFLWGAYKYPREATWLVGVLLFFLTLGMGFTGQVLRWDQTAYWSVGVGAAMAGRVPVLGPFLVDLLLGGPIIAAPTLSRFFSLHVFILPGALLFFLALHLYLVVKHGVSVPPRPGATDDPETYHQQYEEELKRGKPFWPEPAAKDMIFTGLVLTVVFLIAFVTGPSGPGEPPDPTLIQSSPRPDWYFWPLFALLALCPPALETVIILGLPAVLFMVLVLVPFVAGRGERAPSRRPVAVVSVILIYSVLGVLGWLGYQAPWSPVMDAWSSDPTPANLLHNRTPLELQGAVVLQNKQCRNCHALEGIGGHRGPDLTDVGSRLTRQELVRQVIQGSKVPGGLMPAYGNQLSSEEVDALVAFLVTLRPAEEPGPQPPVPPP